MSEAVNELNIDLNWPRSLPVSGCSAWLKSEPEDFEVEELPLGEPTGAGEHVWLWIEKRNANTAWVAARLAEFAGVRELDVGFAGLKDRHAVTRQWFSLYMPKGETPDFTRLDNEEFRILRQLRHERKLRRGDLAGNRFSLRLRDVQGPREALQHNLEAVACDGFPNYFGAQRFGFDGNNIRDGVAMLKRQIRVRNANRKGLYLSAVRSWLFNQVVAERVRQGNWQQCLAGEVVVDGLPSAPLWGRGRSAATDDALLLEQAVLEPLAEIRDALEHAGLSQERRALVVKPKELQWRFDETTSGVDLYIDFVLEAGYYATTLLSELLQVQEPARGESSDEENG